MVPCAGLGNSSKAADTAVYTREERIILTDVNDVCRRLWEGYVCVRSDKIDTVCLCKSELFETVRTGFIYCVCRGPFSHTFYALAFATLEKGTLIPLHCGIIATVTFIKVAFTGSGDIDDYTLCGMLPSPKVCSCDMPR